MTFNSLKIPVCLRLSLRTCLLKNSAAVLHLRGCVSVLEIVFVGQCEVFVCLDFVLLFSLGREAHRSANGVSI